MVCVSLFLVWVGVGKGCRSLEAVALLQVGGETKVLGSNKVLLRWFFAFLLNEGDSPRYVAVGYGVVNGDGGV